MSEEVANEIVNAASSQNGNTSPFFSESANAIISALNGGTVTESTRYSPEVNRIIKAINEGGGSSDFSIAHVSYLKTDPLQSVGFGLIAPLVIDIDGSDGSAVTDGLVATTTVQTVDLILYKGLCYCYVGDNVASVTGDAEADEDGYYFVTGDCTFTLSGGK